MPNDGPVNDDATLLELEDVAKRYASGERSGLEVLRGVSLRVERGASLAIVGPSGSGKTTLLNIIGGLDAPSSGRVLLQGRDLAAMPADELAELRNRSIGFVFQSHHLLPQLTAIENVLVPTLASRRPAGDVVDRARELLQRVGLGERLEHRPGRLSGGECQRVAVVRALINDPILLLADEPTGSLDTASADHLGTLLAELNVEEALTLIIVTHSPRLAERMGRMIELRDGRLAPGEACT